MELTRTIIAISILAFIAGCASVGIKTETPEDKGAKEPQSIQQVDEVPYYEGLGDTSEIKIPQNIPPNKRASLELTNRGKTALYKNQFALASQHLEKAISIDSQNPYAFYYLALLQYRQGDFNAALGHIQLAKINFSNPKWIAESHIMSGRILEELRQWQNAEKEYQKAIEVNPEKQAAQDGLARVQRRIASLESISDEDTENTAEDTGE